MCAGSENWEQNQLITHMINGLGIVHIIPGSEIRDGTTIAARVKVGETLWRRWAHAPWGGMHEGGQQWREAGVAVN